MNAVPSRRDRRLVWPMVVLAAAFVGVQFVRRTLSNPPVVADLGAPLEVKGILKVSCYDCHSNETKLRWFDQIVPAYWLVARDVEQGRQKLNFSDVGGLPAAQQTATLFESVNQAQLGVMPPKAYLLMHPQARLSANQLTVLEDYLRSLVPATAPRPEMAAAADRQYSESMAPNSSPTKVAPAPNGLAFPQDYKNWKAISSTERFDNGTTRVVLGNDVAIRAIATNQINPWPDGTNFAKVAWEQMVDDHGVVRAGPFKQVEFMVKDRKKYASTAGWGWGRWLGTDLLPFGKAANFTDSCVGCHTPMQGNDYVFTMPIKGQQQPASVAALTNQTASLPVGLPHNPLDWCVIASTIDRQKHSMSTLFGNDIAVQHARTSRVHAYPPGSLLSLVTWLQQDDKHWFGARIPARVESIEFVKVEEPTSDNRSPYSYEHYDATSGGKLLAEELGATHARIDAMVEQRAAVMP